MKKKSLTISRKEGKHLEKFDEILQYSTRTGEAKSTDCPLWDVDNRCKIKDIECRYGLTEIKVPRECPLREKDFEERIRIKLMNH